MHGFAFSILQVTGFRLLAKLSRASASGSVPSIAWLIRTAHLIPCCTLLAFSELVSRTHGVLFETYLSDWVPSSYVFLWPALVEARSCGPARDAVGFEFFFMQVLEGGRESACVVIEGTTSDSSRITIIQETRQDISEFRRRQFRKLTTHFKKRTAGTGRHNSENRRRVSGAPGQRSIQVAHSIILQLFVVGLRIGAFGSSFTLLGCGFAGLRVAGFDSFILLLLGWVL